MPPERVLTQPTVHDDSRCLHWLQRWWLGMTEVGKGV